jgi:hypothetical protein
MPPIIAFVVHHRTMSHDVDAPLTDPKEDALRRNAYAERIADMIAAWRGEHSNVLAIYGEWGSGKSTLKNFIVRNLESRGEAQRPIIVEFNPWEWDGPRQVAEAFFASLAEGIGHHGGKAADVSARLSRYAAYFTVGASIAESAGTVLSLFAPGVGPLASLATKALKGAGAQTKSGAEAKPDAVPLDKLRRELKEAVRGLKRTILVTIDDVDRLTTAETTLLFQLLKSNADFPNVVYLLLCDREVVARNLGAAVADRGDEFLEKIVQLGFPLPKAYPEQLRSEFFRAVGDVLTELGIREVIDEDRFANLYDLHVEPYFSTMRDVKRYAASLRTVLPAVVHDGEMEVDVIDFLAIEVLRTFEHEFYEAVYAYRNRDVTVIGRVAATPAAKDLFGELFPPSDIRPRSIADPRYFDRYFLFAVPPDQYREAEKRAVLASRGTRAFAHVLEDARKYRRVLALADVLHGGEPLPVEAEIDYLISIATFQDTLDPQEGVEQGLAWRTALDQVILATLSAHAVTLREGVLLETARHTSGIRFAIAMEEHFTSKDPRGVSSSVTAALAAVAMQKIESADREQLKRHPALAEILQWWSKHHPDDVRSFVAVAIQEREPLLHLLRVFSHRRIVNVGKPRTRRDPRAGFARRLSSYVRVDDVLVRLAKIEPANWEERELIRAFVEDVRKMRETDADSIP